MESSRGLIQDFGSGFVGCSDVLRQGQRSGIIQIKEAKKEFNYSEVHEMQKSMRRRRIGILLGLLTMLAAMPAAAQMVQATVKIEGMV